MKVVSDIGSIAIPAHVLSILPHFQISSGEIEITRGGKNYAYILTALVVISSCIVCIEVLSESHSFKIISMSGDTEEINQTIETLFCIISYTIMVVTGSQNAEKHFRTLNEIAKIDEFLEATGYEGSYKCPKLACSLYVMSTSVIGVAFFYIRRSQMIPNYQFILLGVYIMQLYVSSTFAVYFRVILMNVTRRIEFVNDKLRQFTRDGSRNNEENWRELSNLIEIFCKFRYITENLNAVTGVGLLFYMGYAFYTVTNQSYLAFSTLTNHVAFSEKFQLMGLSASWVFAEIIIMSVLCSSCEAISSEVFNMNRETDNINQYIEVLISITAYTGTVVLCSKHSKDFLKILNETLKLDSDIRNRYGASVRNHCEFTERTVVAILSCQLFIIGVKFSMGSLTMTSQYLILGFYALQNCMCSVFVILLSSVLRLLSMRFEFVNMILGSYTYGAGGIRRRGPGSVPFEEDASFAFRLHNKLLKIYKLVNESCSLLVAFFMGYAFYTITTNTYNIFVEFTTKRDVSVSLLSNCFAWLGLNSALLTILAQSCGQTTKKANTTSQILARVYGKSKDYQNIIDKFLTKSIRQEVQFTAYGFFVVDNSTLFKIFSAVTTYLVILIQFKQLEDTKLDESLDANSE